MLEKLMEAENYLRQQGVTGPETGIILGTGLGGLAQKIEKIQEVSYNDIPHFPVSTVESHDGKLIYGILNGKKVLAMQGRFHYYEGYSMQQIVFPVRVMKLLGIQHLLISNAAGAMNPGFNKGEVMLLTDHIDLLPDSPLRGKNIDELGPRFPDMSSPYAPHLNSQLEEIAQKQNIKLNKGVYAVVQGPNLETPAEYRFLRTIGADVVGMSTVPECIAANHMGLPCCAISVLTDECDPDNLQPVNIEDIIATANKAEVKLTTLYFQLVGRL